MWWASYIGLPFEEHGRGPDGFDCYGLLRAVYADQLGIALPSLIGAYAHTRDARRIPGVVREALQQWQPVTTPRPLDLIVLNVQGRPWHVGIVTEPGWMLHVEHGRDACRERYTGLLWRGRIEGFYRYGH